MATGSPPRPRSSWPCPSCAAAKGDLAPTNRHPFRGRFCPGSSRSSSEVSASFSVIFSMPSSSSLMRSAPSCNKPSLMGLRAPSWSMSSENLETSSSETLEKPWSRSPTPDEAKVVVVAVQPEDAAAAGEDRTAGIEDELGPCVRREEAVEGVVQPVEVPRCPIWVTSPPKVEASFPIA